MNWSSAGGPCEWCGGPQWWSIVRGEMWVACQAECRGDPQYDLLPQPTPSIAIGTEFDSEHWNPTTGEGVEGTPEGGAANGSVIQHIGVPLEAVLHNLWSGGPEHG